MEKEQLGGMWYVGRELVRWLKR